MNEFTSKVIGLPDSKKEKQIIEVYSEICDIATVLVMNLQYYFDSPHFEIREMFDFLKAKDPKEWLYSKFIEYHGLTFPGMNLEKVIQFELVDIPKDYLRETMELRTQILGSISKSKELRFYFPLIKLFHESKDEDCRDFATSYQYEGLYPTTEFDAALFNHVRKFTASEHENEVLTVIENAVNALNDLIEMNIIRNDKQRWHIDMTNLVNAIVFSLNSDRPLSINPMLANFISFRKHFEDNRFGANTTGRPDDILKIEEVDPARIDELDQEEFKELPETLFKPELTKIQPEEVLETE